MSTHSTTGAPARPARTARLGRLVATATLLASAIQGAVLARPAAAAQTFPLQAGLDVERSDLHGGFSANRFGPEVVTINVGDTVTWSINGFHNVSFPGGPAPQAPTPSLAPGEVALDIPGLLPAGGNTYDGTGWVSSGAPQDDDATQAPTYALTFTKPGVFPYLCTIHPGMEGTVIVTPAGAPLPETPAQVQARGQADVQRTAAQVEQQFRRQTTEHVGPVHLELAGWNNGMHGSALAFRYPDITIARGDTVAWTNADPQEPHTVTFLAGQPEPEFIQPRPNPAGPPSFVISADIAQPVGGSVYSGEGYLNSGVLGGFFPDTSWAVTFDAPAGTYAYLCLVHPFMRGTITVTE